jgi:hypothetical protein
VQARNARVTVAGHRPIARNHRANRVTFAQLMALVWALTCANVTRFTQETRAPLLNVPK